MTCNTDRGFFCCCCFVKLSNAANKSEQYVNWSEQRLLSFYYKGIVTVSESFGKISWNLLDTKTVSSHSFCQTWCIYLAVRCFGPEEGMRSSVGSLSRASLTGLSAVPFPRIPTPLRSFDWRMCCGFFLACEDLGGGGGGMFDYSFPACAFFFLSGD